MNIGIDAPDFAREVAFAAQLKPIARRRIWTQVRVASFNAERYIKIAMPVDTGRARSSWGHNGGGASTSAESIWQENEAALVIRQGSRVDYIEPLNEGTSTQAPAGFIDAAERRAVQELTDAIDAELGKLFK